MKQNKNPEILWQFSLHPFLLDVDNIELWKIWSLTNSNTNGLNIDTYNFIKYISQEVNKIHNWPTTVIWGTSFVLDKLKKSNNMWEVVLYQKFKNNELKKKNDLLHKVSITDKLTNLFNRGYMEEQIKNLISNKNRNNVDWSLLILDIDLFKSINDTYWHAIWDVALREISNILKEEFRETDVVWRYGWEEFIIIMPNTSIDSAEKKANQVRQVIQEKLWYSIKDINREVTVSIWISRTELNESNWEDIFKRADKALYVAKNNWRNKVEVSANNVELYKENIKKIV